MKLNTRIFLRLVWGAVSGAIMMVIFAAVAFPESILVFAISGAIGGATIWGIQYLTKDRLWVSIGATDSFVLIVTTVVASLALPLDDLSDEVGGLIGTIMMSGLFMGLVTSYSLTRPLHRLAMATQSIGEHDLSKRVTVEGPREIRTLGQSLNDMAEALQTAETRYAGMTVCRSFCSTLNRFCRDAGGLLDRAEIDNKNATM